MPSQVEGVELVQEPAAVPARCPPDADRAQRLVERLPRRARLVAVLVRLNRQYEAEAAELEVDARAAATVPVLRRHVVLVLVERLDQSTARAIQYARTLTPDELRAVHVASDIVGSRWTRDATFSSTSFATRSCRAISAR